MLARDMDGYEMLDEIRELLNDEVVLDGLCAWLSEDSLREFAIDLARSYDFEIEGDE